MIQGFYLRIAIRKRGLRVRQTDSFLNHSIFLLPDTFFSFAKMLSPYVHLGQYDFSDFFFKTLTSRVQGNEISKAALLLKEAVILGHPWGHFG